MPEDKKTQIGTASPQNAATRTPPPSTNPPPANIAGTAPPSQVDPGTASPKAVTSYLPPQEDPLIGQVLAGRYVISRKLGEGGMGAVYLATHNLLEKQVALKVLHGEFARKQDLVERFMQEAKAASRIRHENVIDISDFGSTPDGQVFFAMELLKGHDLHEEIARARLAGELLPWARSKKIFLQICAALTAAHEKGIIHRDLKPENIYLVDFLGDPDFVKLLDFGIAKLTEGNDGERKLTRTGMLFGTPEYMSPEQARGENVDLRVDIYAMGCILFQLVTGRVPFEAENFMGVLSLHLTEEPKQVSMETLDRIGAPRELTAIIDKALLKDRNQRWQSIAEFANAIRTACGDAIPVAGGSMVMPSVSAPANTTNVRGATTGAVAAVGTPVPQTQPPAGTSSRPNKTAWTGSLQVPDEDAQQAKPQGGSKLPIIIGAAVVVIGGAVVAFIVMNGKKGGDAQTPGSGSVGSAVAMVTPDAAMIAPPVTIDAAPAIVLPDKAVIHLDSDPQGADVFDTHNNMVVGKTPLTFKIPGSLDARQFILRKKSFSDVVVELVPNKADITDKETLTKGAAGTVVVKKLDPKPPVGPGSAVKPPDPPGVGSGSAVVQIKPPDPPKPPDQGSAKPPDPAKPDCPPDEFPCLKQMPKDTPKTPPAAPPAAPSGPATMPTP